MFFLALLWIFLRPFYGFFCDPFMAFLTVCGSDEVGASGPLMVGGFIGSSTSIFGSGSTYQFAALEMIDILPGLGVSGGSTYQSRGFLVPMVDSGTYVSFMVLPLLCHLWSRHSWPWVPASRLWFRPPGCVYRPLSVRATYQSGSGLHLSSVPALVDGSTSRS
jgi:hypothetical protein